MTATRETRRTAIAADLARPNEREPWRLGPLGETLAHWYLIAAIVLGFGALSDMRPRWWYVLTCLPLGVLLLARRASLRRIVVVVPVVLLVCWEIAAQAWTVSGSATRLDLRTTTAMVVCLMVVASLLAVADLVRWYVRGIQAVMALTFLYLLLYPATRTRNISGSLVANWRGDFSQKNVMATVAAFAFPWVLAFLARGRSRTITLAGLVVLILGARSATGLIGLVVGLVLWWWLARVQRTDHRSRSGSIAAALMTLVVAGVAIASSLSSIASAYGKDLTLTGRTSIWAAAMQKVVSRPIQGFGPRALFSNPATSDTLDIWRIAQLPAQHAHNGLLQIQLDVGLVGVVLLLAILIACVIDGIRLFDREPVIARWLITCVGVLAVMSVSEPVFTGAGWLGSLTIMRVIALRTRRGAAHEDQPIPVESWPWAAVSSVSNR